MSQWKQPVPTDINDDPNLTFLDRALFREMLCMAQNKDTLLQFVHSERHYSVPLKRGQVILKVSKIAKQIGMDRKKVTKSIEIVSKWYTELDIKGMPFGLVITIKDYDNLTKMDNGMDNDGTIEEQSKNNRRTSNKSVKSVNNEKNDKDLEETDVSSGNQINQLINLFEGVNPSFKNFYKNTSQRKSLERMVKEHSFERMYKLLEKLEEVVSMPFAPRITTPIELENKFGALKIFMKQEKSKVEKGGVLDARE